MKYLERKGQGAFEYILLLAGVLLIVVLAVVLLRGGIFQSGSKDVQLQSCLRALAQTPQCYNANGAWVITGVPVPIPTACTSYLALEPAGWPGSNAGTRCGNKPA